ncbi:MAG: heme-degrading domain-containing protein [Clostridia bacterium]
MEILEQIAYYKAQEEELQFDFFNDDTAWEIGNIIVKRAKAENLDILTDISLAGRTLFSFSANSATGYNAHWINRKKNSVMLQQMSSMRFGLQLKRDGKFDAISRYLAPDQYAVCGGGFPIIIKNTGVVGCIAVSGLADTDDHEVIVSAIREYLAK